METLIISIISVGCAIVGALVGIFTYKKNQHKDIEVHEKDLKEETQEETREKVQLNAKIDVLLSNNTEIKGSVKDLSNKFDNFKDDFNIRLTRVEESCKNNEKRIDSLEKKGRVK